MTGLSNLTEQKNLWPWLLLTPLAVFLVVFFVVPLIDVAVMSFTEPRVTFANYERALTGGLYQRVFINTWGGPWEAAARAHLFDPFTAETGIQIKTLSPVSFAKLAQQVQTGT